MTRGDKNGEFTVVGLLPQVNKNGTLEQPFRSPLATLTHDLRDQRHDSLEKMPKLSDINQKQSSSANSRGGGLLNVKQSGLTKGGNDSGGAASLAPTGGLNLF